jgi:hypothetical protein
LLALIENTQSVASSRIFRPLRKKISRCEASLNYPVNLESLKHTIIKCLGLSFDSETIFMTTREMAEAESVERLAKRIFSELHRAIISHETGSLEGDVEAIHDMRVAIRRLRVALNNFAVCASKEDRKRLRARLENLADALGAVRDMDVMIAAMKTSLTNRPDEDRGALSALIRRLRARRRLRLRALVNYLRGEEYAGFKREFSIEPISAESSEPIPEIQPEVIEEEHGQAA